jgi:RecA/RadA recombinase
LRERLSRPFTHFYEWGIQLPKGATLFLGRFILSPSSAVAPALSPEPESSPSTLESLFPTGQVSLICGPSGVGKTTLVMQLLADIVAHKPVLGYNSYPTNLPLCYLAMTRPNDATRATLQRLRIPPSDIPYMSVIDDHIPLEPAQVIERVLSRVANCKLLVLDPIMAFVRENNAGYGTIAGILRELTSAAAASKMIILGIGGHSKVKQGEGYAAPRERFAGSIAWSDCTSTMILLEPHEAAKPANPSRTLTILTPNNAPETTEYRFAESGYLSQMSDGLGDYVMDEWLRVQPIGTELLTATMLGVASSNAMPRRSFFRWLEIQQENNLLAKRGRGVYAVSRPS